MTRMIGPKRSFIQFTGKADLGTLVSSLVPDLKGTIITVPAQAIWADVRAIGAGGLSGPAQGGGGGAFARSLIAVTPGESLNAFVDTWPLSATNVPSVTALSRGVTNLVLAQSANGATPGSAANSLGAIKRSGGAGGVSGVAGYNGFVGAAQAVASNPSARWPNQYEPNQYFVGGFSASDYTDSDSLGLGGAGAFLSISPLTALVGIGGGGYIDSRGWQSWPGPGFMIIQFYNGIPPQ